MPPKRKKYTARFPPARIKKIMQTDEEVGKVAAAVPVIISRSLEIFLHSLLTKSCGIAEQRKAKTLTAQHLKWCIESEKQFDFLRDLVSAVPDVRRGAETDMGDGEQKEKRKRTRKKADGEDGAAIDSGKKRSKRQQSFDDEATSEDSSNESNEEDSREVVSGNKPREIVQLPSGLSLPAQSSTVFRPPIGNDGESGGANYPAQFTAMSGLGAAAEDDDYDA